MFLPFLCFSQEEYKKNEHVEIDSYIEDGNYIIDYVFKDHNGVLHNFSMALEKEKTDIMIKKFGVSNSILKTTKKMEKDALNKRNKIIEDAMFIAKDGFPKALNKKALVSYYKQTANSIANYILTYLEKNKNDTRLNRIEMAIKFVQDIPYAIPKENRRAYKMGYITPPEILIDGYGDCDSKTILFACIMSYLINEDDIIFISTPSHIFSAIKDYDYVHEKGYVPQTQREVNYGTGDGFVMYNNSKYFVCETAGPGRSNYGQHYQYQSTQLRKKEDSFLNTLKNAFKYSPATSIYRPTSRIKHCKIETFDLSELVVFPGDCHHSMSMKYVKKEKRRAFDYHSCFMFNPPGGYEASKPPY